LRKILFIATVADHFKCFYLPYFDYFKKNGWQVECACAGIEEFPNCDTCHEISISRSPLNTGNIYAVKQIIELISTKQYDIIHCNTPMGGVLARIAVIKSRRPGTKVIYTAHGFHFFKGAPFSNWLIYFPVERFLSRSTDCLVTINNEDYNAANKLLKARKTVLVHGVGYDNNKFFRHSQDKKSRSRHEHGYADDELLLIYVAELNKNKNQRMLIESLAEILKKRENTMLLLVGQDGMNGRNEEYAQYLGVGNHVHFLGQRNDVADLLPMCDLTIASSLREGLPVNIMESLACGVPVVATDNRGHRELIQNGENGYLVKQNNPEEMAQRVITITGDKKLYDKLSDNACNSVRMYGKDCVLEEMKAVYGRM
jgi:glycosyltransferase EpsD